METFLAIFAQLGVDSSLLPQFVIILVVFILAQFLFLGKLQTVLETREEKTVKLEHSADEKIEKIQKMQNEYNSKIDIAHKDAFKKFSEEKNVIVNKYTEQYKQAEKDVSQFVEHSRLEFEKEVDQNKDQYMSAANQLSDSLVQKILQ
jgi:F0F1-type ATP synthase membrane subunit b/b'